MDHAISGQRECVGEMNQAGKVGKRYRGVCHWVTTASAQSRSGHSVLGGAAGQGYFTTTLKVSHSVVSDTL